MVDEVSEHATRKLMPAVRYLDSTVARVKNLQLTSSALALFHYSLFDLPFCGQPSSFANRCLDLSCLHSERRLSKLSGRLILIRHAGRPPVPVLGLYPSAVEARRATDNLWLELSTRIQVMKVSHMHSRCVSHNAKSD
jgi:hypothetical protein